jgi:hypothetical protein
MSSELIPSTLKSSPLPPVPWRDPHAVSPTDLAQYTQFLEQACEQNPNSADLRVCLGMVYAMDHRAYDSMDALELARDIDPGSFWAQLKYAELQYRLRILLRAEEETEKAIGLARSSWEMALARKQLQEIRALMRHGTQRPEWTKPLTVPALMLALMLVTTFLVMWR